ncbi:methylmalonyl-CoA mutase metallochaperone MeaB [Tenacibaculum sp. MAR_2009_124]|uniref:methylmalonyl Co-A mutase-associated GTPase MeaB n=1 Tax=Tenacibaculum sp. MAR_2009_124 TaxID=1250059 RepID=UPI00089828BB|nr:methylmalonyl Co-A mutase-associated GTPase MeaB [Tenacibaculum sp. MAR_2009_124]SEB36829.1 methylmalonyl-CoA mutase metallochaperone MeaB [Tenacibaculum sp. MAR_2009_124]
MTKKNKSALTEKDGISQPETTNKSSAEKIKLNRRKQPSVKEFVEKILSGNITFLSRAITLVESTNQKHQKKANEILEACLPYANNSVRIGITGVPGVGKSTFIEAFGKYLTSLDKKVAVLAVDPSSSINKGSILGDKTRMEQLVTDKNAFIRPSPSGTSLGGVAQKTRESIILCEAAGYDSIIIETVGVGQSETAVHSMVDFFLLLKLAGAGDELQGIKRGIIEMADAIVINKADGDNTKNAKIAKIEFNRALHLYPPKENDWIPKVLVASALKNKGIDTVYNMINDYIIDTKKKSFFDKKRNKQNKFWLLETINQKLKDNFYNDPRIKELLNTEISQLENGKTTPFSSANRLLKESENKKKV